MSLFTIFNFGFFLLTISILISIMGYLHQNESFNWNNLITDFYANVGTELGSLSLTILVVDYLYKRQSKEELKQSLIREMSSTDNGIALRAVKELKANGWLQDGSLQDIRLEGANLKDADLTDADLSGVRFFDTNLSYANLANAILKDGIMINTNLSGANLAKSNLMNLNQMLLDSTVSKEMNNKQLRRAYKLIGSTMPDGSTYDGRFNLKGDLETIQWNFRNADINTEEGVAKNYGVSVEEYRLGQDWYNKNLVNENENSPIAINSSFSHFALGALISVSSYIFWKILKHLQPKTKNLPKNGAEMPNFQQND